MAVAALAGKAGPKTEHDGLRCQSGHQPHPVLGRDGLTLGIAKIINLCYYQ